MYHCWSQCICRSVAFQTTCEIADWNSRRNLDAACASWLVAERYTRCEISRQSVKINEAELISMMKSNLGMTTWCQGVLVRFAGVCREWAKKRLDTKVRNLTVHFDY